MSNVTSQKTKEAGRLKKLAGEAPRLAPEKKTKFSNWKKGLLSILVVAKCASRLRETGPVHEKGQIIDSDTHGKPDPRGNG